MVILLHIWWHAASICRHHTSQRQSIRGRCCGNEWGVLPPAVSDQLRRRVRSLQRARPRCGSRLVDKPVDKSVDKLITSPKNLSPSRYIDATVSTRGPRKLATNPAEHAVVLLAWGMGSTLGWQGAYSAPVRTGVLFC